MKTSLQLNLMGRREERRWGTVPVYIPAGKKLLYLGRIP
jgi:hypothetical protein